MRCWSIRRWFVVACGDTIRYDRENYVCCDNELHEKKPHWTCCGGDWISKDEQTCLFNVIAVDRKTRKCGRVGSRIEIHLRCQYPIGHVFCEGRGGAVVRTSDSQWTEPGF